MQLFKLWETELLDAITVLNYYNRVSMLFTSTCHGGGGEMHNESRTTEMHSILIVYENIVLLMEHWDDKLL